ncbi:putative plant bZIP transcription factor [Helianthus annuus]|nr:putative plant bZIP transcription factor [Helianthus annuus]
MGSNGLFKSDGLARQSSIYNLTLDEVQHQLGDLGKPLTSMNLDELLKSVCTAETNMNLEPVSGSDLGSFLARQSSVNVAQDLRKKTVNEVWQDIQQGQKRSNDNDVRHKRGDDQERQCTLGEMTLEGFLAKAGIVAGSGNKSVDSNVSNQQHAQWMQYQVTPIQPQESVYIVSHRSVGANTRWRWVIRRAKAIPKYVGESSESWKNIVAGK